MKSTLTPLPPPRREVQRSGAASAEHITSEQMNYSACFFTFLGNNSRIPQLNYTHAELISHASSDSTLTTEPILTHTFTSG